MPRFYAFTEDQLQFILAVLYAYRGDCITDEDELIVESLIQELEES